jgi:putative ABC transport system permease protein
LFILLYVRDELSYDRHHENADRIYRVGLDAVISGKDIHTAVTAAPLAATLRAEYPEVEAATRLYKANRVLINHEHRRFYEERFLWADSTVFQALSFPLLRGDEATALNGPHKIVITASAAHKYFGNLDPLGKVLRVDNRDDYVVNGDIFSNLFLKFICTRRRCKTSARTATFAIFIFSRPSPSLSC